MNKKTLLSSLIAVPFLLQPIIVSAEPPSWAPAHGHRKKHKNAEEESRVVDTRAVVVSEPAPQRVVVTPAPAPVVAADIGISRGTCNRDTVGAVLGGVVGGVVGSQIGRDQGNQQAGMVLGAVVGVLVGKTIGKQMDDADKKCTAQVFEQAKNGQTVAWKNPDAGTEYRMTPVNSFTGSDGVPCRTYNSVVLAGDRREEGQKVACRAADGTWNVKTASR